MSDVSKESTYIISPGWPPLIIIKVSDAALTLAEGN